MFRLSNRVLFPVAILVIGINLRPAMAAIGSLLDAIQRDTTLSDTGASLLTTLPVILMGVFLLNAGRLKRLLGENRGVVIGLGLILLSSLLRWVLPGAGALLATAVLAGVGIAIVQALLPIVIRQRAGAQSAGLMGYYSTAIMSGAFLASTASPWIAQALGWPVALGIWAVPALLGILIWRQAAGPAAPAPAPAATPAAAAPQRRSILRIPRAWLLLTFFGLGTGAYTLVLAWLPPFYTGLGWSAKSAGMLLGTVTLAEMVAGVAVSVWVDRSADRRPAIFAAIGAMFIGLIGLAMAPLTLAWPAAVLAGLGIGALFPLGLIVAMDHGRSADEAGAIAGFVQGGGYIIAAALPFAAGLLRQHLSDLTPAWWLMAALCLVLWAIAFRFRAGSQLSFSNEPRGA